MKNAKNLERKFSADRITCFLPLYYNPLRQHSVTVQFDNFHIKHYVLCVISSDSSPPQRTKWGPG